MDHGTSAPGSPAVAVSHFPSHIQLTRISRAREALLAAADTLPLDELLVRIVAANLRRIDTARAEINVLPTLTRRQVFTLYQRCLDRAATEVVAVVGAGAGVRA